MAIRLNKVTRELNVGVSTAVEFLKKKGHTIEESPNALLTEEQHGLLVQAFSTDKHLRQASDQFSMDRQQNKPPKTQVSIPGFKEDFKKPKEAKHVSNTSGEIRQRYNPVGKIDLNELNRRPEKPVEQAKEVPAATPEKVAPMPEAKPSIERPAQEAKKVTPNEKPEVKPQPTIPTASKPVSEPKKDIAPASAKTESQKAVSPTPKGKSAATPVKAGKPTVAAETEENKTDSNVFRLRTAEPTVKLNVVGQIDLTELNTSTRPKKKSKAERQREREEREQQRQDQRKQMKDAIIKEIRKESDTKSTATKPKVGSSETAASGASTTSGSAKRRRKRDRINKERVDINKAASAVQPDKNKNHGRSGAPNAGKDPHHAGDRRKDRHKKQVVKEVSEEDVAKQVKETLARLTSKGKTKTAKYRKEKRETAFTRQQEQENIEASESKVLKLTEYVTANELATMMGVPVTQVIATCMSVGIMLSINQRLDAETINLVAEEFGFRTEYVSADVAQAVVEEEDAPEDLQPRAPIVTVMGHVDHGKTSLLDYIRKSNVIAGEAGGITQHIGAYNVALEDGRHITFLDTPGHEAFTAMRARGAKVTDVVIIIVAADDNVMPQTREAINHAVAANVPIIFAINKIDKPGANPDRIKEELAAMNFLVEEWGGKYQSQDISAKQGIGVPELLEKVLLEAEMLELKANPNRKANGSIIESTLDKGRGYVATVLVSNGTLRMGDIVLAGTHYGRIKAMFNERNQRIKTAGPSEPALLLGMNGAPNAGDSFHVIETEQEAREITNKREQLQREQGLRTQKILTLDELGRRLAVGDFHELNIIVKGDVDGSIEALSDSLIKLSTEQIQVNVIHKGVGQISESDVTLSAASDAIIIGFQVRPSAAARKMAEQEGVDIRLYSVIYDAIEEVKAAMEGMLAPQVKEEVTSSIEVREVFHISKVGTVAGAMVKEGKVKRSDKARLIRAGIVIYTGTINALKRFKEDVKEVAVNYECGISLTGYNDIQVGDVIETYQEVEVKQTL
ncbi:MAG: translation initiation factor IF-2 [Prevotellaceae bacterium]|jgi:translation initiation factor IF-2|nr:translation initiation factor IF-2 [Prevotellaceae bacterium]